MREKGEGKGGLKVPIIPFVLLLKTIKWSTRGRPQVNKSGCGPLLMIKNILAFSLDKRVRKRKKEILFFGKYPCRKGVLQPLFWSEKQGTGHLVAMQLKPGTRQLAAMYGSSSISSRPGASAYKYKK